MLYSTPALITILKSVKSCLHMVSKIGQDPKSKAWVIYFKNKRINPVRIPDVGEGMIEIYVRYHIEKSLKGEK